MIEAALEDAKIELATLTARKAELEELVARAQSALAPGLPAGVIAGERLTLHEALAKVLRENENRWMAVRELADAVNERKLYSKKDGTPVEVNQVHARTNNYAALFEKDGGKIRLREESTMLTIPTVGVAVFKDGDAGFFEWLEAHPDGYLINTYRNPKPNYLVLHRSGCPHFKGSPELHWTKDYVKVCSDVRGDLEEWANEAVGGEVTLCPSQSCFG